VNQAGSEEMTKEDLKTPLQQLLEITQSKLTQKCVKYLKQRGITKQSADKWQIGYVPSHQDVIDLQDLDRNLYDLGILIRTIDKTPLEKYITFPLYNQYNRLIGFSGRPPISNQQVKQLGLKKYWHSRFSKRNFLYGLNNAIKSARELNYIIVAEGQFDCIIASQYQIENIVSTCGTALTSQQVTMLSRYVDKAYIVFDNDEAGIKAFKQLERHKDQKITLVPIYLPNAENGEKEDPDSYIRKHGKDKFLEQLGIEVEN